MLLRKYVWNDVSIKVNSNCECIFDEITEYLELYGCDSSDENGIYVEFYRMEECEIEKLYRFYSQNVSDIRSIPFEIDRKIMCYSFLKGNSYISYFQGYSLVITDYEKMSIKIFRPNDFNFFKLWNIQLCVASPLLRLAEKFGYVKIHAACFENNGNAVLIIGGSGAGKSTCTFNLAVNGINVISDEWTVVKKAGEVYSAHSILKYIKIDGVTLSGLFGNIKDVKKFHVFGENIYFKKSDFSLREKHSDGVAVETMLFISGKHGEHSVICDLDTPDIVWNLFPVTMNSVMPKETLRNKFDFLTDMVSDESIIVKKLISGSCMDDLRHKLLEKAW